MNHPDHSMTDDYREPTFATEVVLAPVGCLIMLMPYALVGGFAALFLWCCFGVGGPR